MGAESSSMQNAATSCKACKDYGQNRQNDTVKVDLDKIRDPTSSADKENINNLPGEPPQMAKETAAQKQMRAAQAKLEEEAKRREEEEERQRQEVDSQREEILRQKKAEEQRQRQEAMLRQRQEEEQLRALEERRQQEEAQRMELARIAEERRMQRLAEQERQRALEEARQQAEEAERQKALEQKQADEKTRKLRGLLETAGFRDVDEKKVKKGMLSSGFSYPLHAAVEAKDPEFVELLLWAGADPRAQNSKKLTPLQLAEQKNDKKNSHARVIAVLKRASA